MKKTKDKISFKKYPRSSGLMGVGEAPITEVKLNGKHWGQITGPGAFTENNWRIQLAYQVEPTKEKPAPFAWYPFKQRFQEEKEAREWLQQWFATGFQNWLEPYTFED